MLEAGTRVGPYRIVSPLGAGGMGEVYRAHDARLGREVAVKVLPERLSHDPDRLRRFEREARAAAALGHPNILAIYDVGTHEGQPYIVTELLEGQTLRELIREGLTVAKAVELAVEIANGLAAAHERGVVHRDLKPTNLLVTRAGVVKILDFGLAKLIETGLAPEDLTEAPTEEAPTGTGAIIGTAGYMAPEQVRGQAADHRADIFAFGCVLFEMLSGQRAFKAETNADTAAAILSRDAPSLTDADRPIPRALERIVRRCLEKRPDDRFQSARDVAFALQALAGATSTSVERVVEHRPRRTWVLAAAGVVIVLAATAAVLILLQPRDVSLEPAAWVPRRLTTSPAWEAEPAISPDGSLVAYTSDESGNRDIWLLDVNGESPIRLTGDAAADYHPAWFPDSGSIAYASDRDGTTSIMRVPRLGGSPTLLLENAADPAISPDGTRLAFARFSSSGTSRIGVAAIDHPSRIEMLTGDAGGLWNHLAPTWSPDGRTLCYADLRDLWLVPARGGSARRLTTEDGGDKSPTWSRNECIYFSSGRGGTTAVWGMRAGGGAARRLTTGTGHEVEPSVSRDGTRLVYATYDSNQDVVVLDRQTGRAARLPSGGVESSPAMMPDGSGVIFASDRSGKFDLWYQALQQGHPVGDPRRITDHPGSVATPAVSPDGRWVAYFRVTDGRRDIWLVPWPMGVPRQFTDDAAVDVNPAFSPDGTQLAFVSDRNGGEHVYIEAVADGRPAGPPRQVTAGESSDLFPSWSPDGRHIAFIRKEGRESDVWVVDVRDEGCTRVTKSGQAWAARWARSGRGLEVLGSWGTNRPELRLVDLSGGLMATDRPGPHLGNAPQPELFDISRDGRYLAYVAVDATGDVWLMQRMR